MDERRKAARGARPFRAGLATLVVAAWWSGWITDAAGETGKSVPAKGTVSLSKTEVDGPLKCQLAKLGVLLEAKFDANLRWGDDEVVVSSPNGEFSCSLNGTKELNGTSPCMFFVGGGSARTEVRCDAANVKGTRKGDGLKLTATNCHATWQECKITSDLAAVLTPK